MALAQHHNPPVAFGGSYARRAHGVLSRVYGAVSSGCHLLVLYRRAHIDRFAIYCDRARHRSHERSLIQVPVGKCLRLKAEAIIFKPDAKVRRSTGLIHPSQQHGKETYIGLGAGLKGSARKRKQHVVGACVLPGISLFLYQYGGLAERSIAPISKIGILFAQNRGFESPTLRHQIGNEVSNTLLEDSLWLQSHGVVGVALVRRLHIIVAP